MTVSVPELGFSNFLKVDLRVKILITEVFLGVLWVTVKIGGLLIKGIFYDRGRSFGDLVEL